MSELSLPKNFDEYIDSRKTGFIEAKEYVENSGKIAGYLCSYAPLEIFEAAGLASVGLCGMSNETVPAAEAVLPANLCPLIKSTYGFALKERCPYTYFADIIVGETTCDGKKKMYELLSQFKNMHVMQLPQGRHRPYAGDIWYEECKLLVKTLEEQLGVGITEEKLRAAAHARNRYRRAVLSMYELEKMDPPAISGEEVMSRVMKGTFNFDPGEVASAIEELVKEARAGYDAGERRIPTGVRRIMLTGCPSDGVVDKVACVIENNNASIVCLDTCSGERTMRLMVDEDAPDILRAISDRYLGIHCSVMTPNDDRLESMRDLITENNIQGVVEVVLTGCHTFNVESVRTSGMCREIGVPYLKIETDYSDSDAAQLRTRIEAFLEMI